MPRPTLSQETIDDLHDLAERRARVPVSALSTETMVKLAIDEANKRY